MSSDDAEEKRAQLTEKLLKQIHDSHINIIKKSDPYMTHQKQQESEPGMLDQGRRHVSLSDDEKKLNTPRSKATLSNRDLTAKESRNSETLNRQIGMHVNADVAKSIQTVNNVGTEVGTEVDRDVMLGAAAQVGDTDSPLGEGASRNYHIDRFRRRRRTDDEGSNVSATASLLTRAYPDRPCTCPPTMQGHATRITSQRGMR